MERNDAQSQGYKLESQLREAYGKVTYSQTCHDKLINRILKHNDWLKISQIVLSAMTTSGFVVTIFVEEKIANIAGAVISLILLIVNTYCKNINLEQLAHEHKMASDLLWKIREEYVSLLTDFEIMSLDDILSKRDELQGRTHQVYSEYPRTDVKSYQQAQAALKTEEEQTFSEHEIDVMLPDAIRRCNRAISDM